MTIYTAALSAQNTSVLLCNIHKPRAHDEWFANVMVTGSFGSGTVTLQASFDGGTTKIPLVQDGTATAAALTAAGTVNLRSGVPTKLGGNLTLYASIATATNPSISIIVADNN